MGYTRSQLNWLIGLSTFIIAWSIFSMSCKKEEKDKDPCKYSTKVKPVIAAKCAIPGCHGAGSKIADFTIDSVVKSKADNSRMRSMVFELNIMPTQSAATLTDQEKEILKCWLDNGAAQN